ncbi:DUF1552 domain-containing protein [Sorangium sp. So ce117]|uniref:DUF1552 domain-containing protein n=1 Tax=Sorangium sp. So ce117 TaxID=3133277 RepID=UPI003F6326FF
MKRRVFLKGVAGAALAAPFLSSVHEREVKAQSAPQSSPPRRLVIFYTHNGCLTNRWFPTIESGALTAEHIKGTTLAGLTPFVSKLLFPRGLKMFNSYAEIQSIDPHDQAMGGKLTCALISDDKTRYATSHSLDHEIAKQINPGKASPLVLSVGPSSSSIKEVLSFSAPNTAFPAVVNPKTVYQQLTGLFGGGQETEADYRVKRGQSAIDLVKDDLQSYQRLTMSKSDQRRISDWLDLLRSTEQNVAPTACNEATAATVGVTAAKIDAASSGGGFGAGLATSFTAGGDMMMNLMALSMICDMNRSMILVYPGYVTFDWDNISHDADHHGLSHRNGSFAVGGTCKNGVLDMIAQIDAWYAAKYVRFVTLLDSIAEGDRTLLDNTATMWLPELADGNAHNTNNLPIVIAGSAGGYLKQGQVVNVDGGKLGTGNSEADCTGGDTSVGFGTGSNTGNVPINKLYVTLMNAVGCTAAGGGPVTEFGKLDSRDAQAGITKPGELTALKA